MTELHQKYAPILRYAEGERFFPMRVEDMLRYSSLHAKGQPHPVIPRGEVTPEQLARYGQSSDIFLRSVAQGPTSGVEVARQWGAKTIELVYRWSQETREDSVEVLTQYLSDWVSPAKMGSNRPFWWRNFVRPLLDTMLAGDPEEELPRFSLPSETQASAIDQFETYVSYTPSQTYYYRQVQDGAFWCLQYWFFYSYNDWAQGFGGFNDHEGDWENIMLFFPIGSWGEPQEPPAYISYAAHHARQTKRWDDPQVEKIGSHPVGYVAAGSHACYPAAVRYALPGPYPLTDYATGTGSTIDQVDWLHRIDLEAVPWLTEFRGSWGTRYWFAFRHTHRLFKLATLATPLSLLVARTLPPEIALPGVSAPHGPMLSGPDRPRPQWATPVAWAELPE